MKKQDSQKKSPQPKGETQALQEKIALLEKDLQQSKEAAQRSLADYQNLVRRSREDKMRFAQMANLDLLEALIPPLDHLSMAASQLNDPGLDMVVQQFNQVLETFDFREIEVLGKPFDVETMEVVEKKGDSDTVSQVVKKGYTLNGVIVQHAKVILGE